MILITGGAGYIGSHTVINLLKKNKELVIFDNLSTGHIETVNTLKKIGKIYFEKGDLQNISDIESVFKKYNIDSVIHFAGYTLVEESVKNPSKYYRNNTFSTLNLLDTMIKHNCKKMVFSSTCAIYGSPKYVPIDENHPINPVNPYGKSKYMIESILDDYDRQFALKYICLRYFNVAGADSSCRIGEWHNPESHLIPNIIKSSFDNSGKFKIFGNDYNTPDGTCIRDYVNVEDLAEAHSLALNYLDKNNQSDVFNVGTENGYSVKEIFDISEKIMNKKIHTEVLPRRAGDVEVLLADARKIKDKLGWSAKQTIEKSITTAYNWECKLAL